MKNDDEVQVSWIPKSKKCLCAFVILGFVLIFVYDRRDITNHQIEVDNRRTDQSHNDFSNTINIYKEIEGILKCYILVPKNNQNYNCLKANDASKNPLNLTENRTSDKTSKDTDSPTKDIEDIHKHIRSIYNSSQNNETRDYTIPSKLTKNPLRNYKDNSTDNFNSTNFYDKSKDEKTTTTESSINHSKNFEKPNRLNITGKLIFFLETSFSSENGTVTFNNRKVCSIESAALANPQSKINVLIFTKRDQIFDQSNVSETIKYLFKYRNVVFTFMELSKYFQGTPVEELYKSGKLDQSYYSSVHYSDVLRVLTLWKYGGIYLDLDMIVKKPLDEIPLNFACAESVDESINQAIIGLGGEKGKEFGKLLLEDVKKNFNGTSWISNGPELFKRVLTKICHTELILKMTPEACSGFHVLPTEYFYSIPWQEEKKFFNSSDSDEVMRRVKNSYVVHIWNSINHESKLNVNSTAAYILLAKKFCPTVFENSVEVF